LSASAGSALAPGDTFADAYRIEALLGRGGHGAVYRATHIATGRTVALKTLLPELVADEFARARFRREAELALRLAHPHVVRVYDFDCAADGRAFIVFELLQGEPLDAAIGKGPMPAVRVAHIAGQLLKALMAVHACGIVHRDVKPSNVMLCAYAGAPDFVKLLGFGIARTTTGHTATGDAATAATDVYAVGLVMAEAARAPLSPGVLEGPFGWVVERATRKDPAARFASAAEMLEALDAACRALAPTASMPGPVASQRTLAGNHAFSPQPPMQHPAMHQLPVQQLRQLPPPPAPRATVSPWFAVACLAAGGLLSVAATTWMLGQTAAAPTFVPVPVPIEPSSSADEATRERERDSDDRTNDRANDRAVRENQRVASTPSGAAPQATPPNSTPPPTKADPCPYAALKQSMDAVLPNALACNNGQRGPVSVDVLFVADGSVSTLGQAGFHAGGPVGHCISQVFLKARSQPFTGVNSCSVRGDYTI
jgi:serine/threonine protein kinase